MYTRCHTEVGAPAKQDCGSLVLRNMSRRPSLPVQLSPTDGLRGSADHEKQAEGSAERRGLARSPKARGEVTPCLPMGHFSRAPDDALMSVPQSTLRLWFLPLVTIPGFFRTGWGPGASTKSGRLGVPWR